MIEVIPAEPKIVLTLTPKQARGVCQCLGLVNNGSELDKVTTPVFQALYQSDALEAAHPDRLEEGEGGW